MTILAARFVKPTVLSAVSEATRAMRVLGVALLAGGCFIKPASPHDAVARFEFEGSPVDLVSGVAATCFGACPTYAPGKHGMAAMFDGNTQCLQLGDRRGFDGPDFSVAAWFDQTTDAHQSIVAKPYTPSASTRDSWQIEAEQVLVLDFTTANAGRSDIQAIQRAATLGQWLHVAITWDGTTKRIYVGGALAAEVDDDPIEFDSSPVVIGCDINTSTRVLGFAGLIDDVVIYDSTLTGDEVMSLAR